MKLTVELPVRPVPNQRPRHAPTKSGRVITYTPKESKRFQGQVRAAAYIAACEQGWPLGYSGPVRANVTLVFTDKRHGDDDNYEKNIFDGLQGKGGVLRNDKQIADHHTTREYGPVPGFKLVLEPILDDQHPAVCVPIPGLEEKVL